MRDCAAITDLRAVRECVWLPLSPRKIKGIKDKFQIHDRYQEQKGSPRWSTNKCYTFFFLSGKRVSFEPWNVLQLGSFPWCRNCAPRNCSRGLVLRGPPTHPQPQLSCCSSLRRTEGSWGLTCPREPPSGTHNSIQLGHTASGQPGMSWPGCSWKW